LAGAGRDIRAARSAALSAPGTSAADGSTNAPSTTGVDGVADLRVDDVGDDHCHVVRPATAQGELDQPVGGLLRVVDLHRLGNGLGRDDVGQAVRAEQVAVAGPCLADRHVRLDVGAEQRAQDHRLARVVLGLVRCELAGVDEVLDVGVVVGDLGEHVVAQQVRARVPDVDEADLRTDEAQSGERGAHALEVLALLHRVGDPVIRLDDGVAQHAHQVVDAPILVQRLEGADDDLARHLARRVPAHAVGDRQQPRSGVDGVLVVVADEAQIGPDRVTQVEGH
jgi:hypothetical protein